MHETIYDEKEGVPMLPACWSSSMMCPQKPYILSHKLAAPECSHHTCDPRVESGGPTEIRLRERLRKDVTGCCPNPDMSTPHAWVLHHLDTRYLRRVRASIWCVSQWTLELSRKHVTNLSTGHAQTPLLASSYILHQPTTQLSPSDGPSSPVVKNFSNSYLNIILKYSITEYEKNLQP